MPLLVLASSASDGGLACSASLITLHLNVDHPTGGFPTVGDGIFLYGRVKTGVIYINKFLFPIGRIARGMCFATPVTKITVLAQKLFIFCSTSPSDSVWVTVVVYVGLVKICGGYLIPLSCRYICLRSIILLSACLSSCGVPSFFWILYDTFGPFPTYAVLLCPGVGILDHGEFSPCGLNCDLYL